MDSLVQDVRYAVRMLLKARGFTAVAVFTLALGIGANATVFSIVNAVLLRPLALDHPERLAKVWGQVAKEGILQNWISEPEIWDLRDGVPSLAAIAAYNPGTGANLTRGAGEPLRVTVSQASAELLPMLGVKPALGRLFSSEEDIPGREHGAVLDYAFWKSQMGGDAGVLGHGIQLNGETFTVIGVLPAVIAYSVSQRTQEIGIRMALGASQGDVLHMVVRGGLRLAVSGVVLGLVLAMVAGRFMSTLLFGVQSTDLVTFGVVAVVLLTTAAFAAWVPARRATHVDPMIALRAE